MPQAIAPHLLDMMSDTVSCQPGTLDGFGKFTAVGVALVGTCHISGKNRMIRDNEGNEVVSSLKVIVVDSLGAALGLLPDTPTLSYRYTLPNRYIPNSNLTALAVKPVQDENGPHHEVVYFA